MTKAFLCIPFNAVLVLTAALLVTLSGCVGYVERPRAAAVYVEPVFIEVDDYVYYPRYQMYYGSRSQRYYYQEGHAWVAHPHPRGVSTSVILSSPSVRVDFHNGLPTHHPQVIKTYPKNWAPPRGNSGHNEGQREDGRR